MLASIRCRSSAHYAVEWLYSKADLPKADHPSDILVNGVTNYDYIIYNR